MKTWKTAALALGLLLSHGAVAAGPKIETVDIKPEPGGFDLPAWQRTQLSNGLVVLLMEQHEVPMVEMRLLVASGAASDPPGKEGLADLTATLLTAGTTRRSASQLAAEVDFLGAALSADAGMDASSVVAGFLSRDVDKQLELLADVALSPAFAPEEVARIKDQRLAELATWSEDPRDFANALFETSLFNGSPYGHPPAGLKASVATVTEADIRAFWSTHYTPANAILAVVGDFKSKEMLKKVEKTFGAWKGKAPAEPTFPAPPTLKGRQVELVDQPGLTQSQIRMGAVGVDRKNPDLYAIQVANTALGGGFTSRLVEEVRVNRSLTYSAGSGFTSRQQPGPYMVSTFTKNETLRLTIDVVLEVLGAFRAAPMPAAELEKARNYLLGQFPLQLETAEGLAGMLVNLELYGLPRDYVETYAARVRALTPEQVQAAVQRYFPTDDLRIVIFTDVSATRAQLEGLGPMEVKTWLQ